MNKFTKKKLLKLAKDILRQDKDWRFVAETTDSLEFWCRGTGNSLDGIFRIRQEDKNIIGVFHPGSGEKFVKIKAGRGVLSNIKVLV